MAAGSRKSATRFYSIYSEAVGHVHRSGQKLGLTPAMRTSSVAPVENVPLPARRVSIRLGSGMAVLFSTSKVPAASMFLPCVKFHSARFTCPYVVSVARIWHGARGRLKEHFRCLVMPLKRSATCFLTASKLAGCLVDLRRARSVGSSCGPPGACMTSSRLTNATFLMSISFGLRVRTGLQPESFFRIAGGEPVLQSTHRCGMIGTEGLNADAACDSFCP